MNSYLKGLLRMRTYLTTLLFIGLMYSSLVAGESRRDYVVMYGPAVPGMDTLMANRYELTVEARVESMNVIRRIKPDFLWFHYISIEDAATSGRKNYIDSLMILNGVDLETLYMHYWDYTEVTLQGTTLICPGLANAVTRQDTIDSRIPIYYSNRARALNNLYSPYVRQYDKMYACKVLSTLPYNYGVTSTVGYLDGIFWDNGSWCLYNTGQRIIGGQIAEHPTHANLGDIGCNGSQWWWESCLKPFYQAFVDTLNQSSSWHPDGKQKYSMPNIANSWTDDYVTAGTAHFLCAEFVPRWDMRDMFVTAYGTHDSLAHENGVKLLYSSLTNTTLDYYEGSYTHEEAIVNNLALFYVFSSPSSYQFHMPHTGVNPNQDGWDSLTWIGAMDYDIGESFQFHYVEEASGVDGRGYTYNIYSRVVQNAKVFFRTRGNYNQHFDDLTNVTLQLNGSYRELLPSGNLGNPVSSIGFRNGTGRIMIPFASDDSIPPANINDLESEIGSIPGSILLNWTETGDDSLIGVASYTVIKYSTSSPITESNWAQANLVPSPPVPSTPEVAVQFEIQNLTEGQFYYVAIQTYDDAGQGSGLATTSGFARGIKRPTPLFTNIDTINAEVEVGCSTVNSYLTLTYEFALDTVNQFPGVSNRSPTLQLSDTSALFDNLVDGVQYHWSCRAMDVGGTDSSNWSGVTSFYLDSGVSVPDLTVAELISPQEGDTMFQSQISFSVDYILGLTTVYFQVDDNPDFNSPLESGSSPVTAGYATVWHPAMDIDTSGTYYWRASADNLNWTESISFYLAQETIVLEAEGANPYPFPNPFNLTTTDHVTFTDMPVSSNLNILTMLGHRVRRLTSIDGEDIMWDGRNEDGKRVASAVYLWYIEDTNVSGKLVLVR